MFRSSVVLCLLLCLWACTAIDPVTVSLNGEWSLANTNGSLLLTSAVVPGDVHIDLMKAKIIGNPYYRYNEREYQWIVMEKNWIYTKVFDSPTISGAKYVDLVFYGLDTVCTITLNGYTVGTTANMFRTFRFDVSSLLKPTQNKLIVTFNSPVTYAADQKAKSPYYIPIIEQKGGLQNRQFIRKAQSDFGWDWGPAFTPIGIWGDVELIYFSDAYLIKDVVFTQAYPSQTNNAQHYTTATAKQQQSPSSIRRGFHAADRVPFSTDTLTPTADTYANEGIIVSVTAYLRIPLGTTVSGKLSVSVAGQTHDESFIFTPDELTIENEFLGKASISWSMVPPALWWPIGYGEHPLFPLTASFTTDNGKSVAPNRMIGFRHFEAVREAEPDQEGLSFYFRVNGVPVYSKGMNVIPFDSFHNRVQEINVTRALEAALEANANTVRVWGGGIYQPNHFYETADKLGLLVWQEFAFACAMYPRSAEFLQTVRAEVHDQVRRLSHHASVIMFGGNNENEAMYHDSWDPAIAKNRELYVTDFAKLYLDVVRDSLRDIVNDRVEFIASSPTNGPLATEPYVNRWGNPQDVNYGDVHFYNYLDDCTNPDMYPKARFVSEFGLQSHPSHITYLPVTEAEDRKQGSPLMQYRQRSDSAEAGMGVQIPKHFTTPSSSDPATLFNHYLYITQACQAYCYDHALSLWRRIKHEVPGRTMGMIYWQLNDIWPGPSWSSLEYEGRWKMLHYHVKRTFAPFLVTGYTSGTTTKTLHIYVTSDLTRGIEGQLKLQVWSYAGKTGNSFTINFLLPALDSTEILDAPLKDYTYPFCTAEKQCFITFTVTEKSTGAILAQNELFLTSFKEATLSTPKIRVVSIQMSNTSADTAVIQILSDQVALFTWLETAAISGRFSDNGFLALPNQLMLIEFKAYEPFTLDTLRQTLSVRSLRDTYKLSGNTAPPAIPAIPDVKKSARLNYRSQEL
eukprot:TRINITY_DN6099_c0_g1_i1.p1 TRINITY_DN6099_c0_g1~~TRINITY_DN6099_c0_g1_i1.p1  ORF type:complete len:964 (+),score=272.46 TRINITY_DN6099_c0_g1_i1:92-2983(+)